MTLVPYTLGGKTIWVTREDFNALLTDEMLYGNVYVKATRTDAGMTIYERIDPAAVSPA